MAFYRDVGVFPKVAFSCMWASGLSLSTYHIRVRRSINPIVCCPDFLTSLHGFVVLYCSIAEASLVGQLNSTVYHTVKYDW